MKLYYYKARKIRKSFIKAELEKQVLKSFCYDRSIDVKIRYLFLHIFNGWLPKLSLTRVQPRCLNTSKSKGLFRFFLVSRAALRRQLLYGFIAYVKPYIF
jgi:ribosomal protein S14